MSMPKTFLNRIDNTFYTTCNTSMTCNFNTSIPNTSPSQSSISNATCNATLQSYSSILRSYSYSYCHVAANTFNAFSIPPMASTAKFWSICNR